MSTSAPRAAKRRSATLWSASQLLKAAMAAQQTNLCKLLSKSNRVRAAHAPGAAKRKFGDVQSAIGLHVHAA
jgi:hypothetical protein